MISFNMENASIYISCEISHTCVQLFSVDKGVISNVNYETRDFNNIYLKSFYNNKYFKIVVRTCDF
jgi:hypothetical protein